MASFIPPMPPLPRLGSRAYVEDLAACCLWILVDLKSALDALVIPRAEIANSALTKVIKSSSGIDFSELWRNWDAAATLLGSQTSASLGDRDLSELSSIARRCSLLRQLREQSAKSTTDSSAFDADALTALMTGEPQFSQQSTAQASDVHKAEINVLRTQLVRSIGMIFLMWRAAEGNSSLEVSAVDLARVILTAALSRDATAITKLRAQYSLSTVHALTRCATTGFRNRLDGNTQSFFDGNFKEKADELDDLFTQAMQGLSAEKVQEIKNYIAQRAKFSDAVFNLANKEFGNSHLWLEEAFSSLGFNTEAEAPYTIAEFDKLPPGYRKPNVINVIMNARMINASTPEDSRRRLEDALAKASRGLEAIFAAMPDDMAQYVNNQGATMNVQVFLRRAFAWLCHRCQVRPPELNLLAVPMLRLFADRSEALGVTFKEFMYQIDKVCEAAGLIGIPGCDTAVPSVAYAVGALRYHLFHTAHSNRDTSSAYVDYARCCGDAAGNQLLMRDAKTTIVNAVGQIAAEAILPAAASTSKVAAAQVIGAATAVEHHSGGGANQENVNKKGNVSALANNNSSKRSRKKKKKSESEESQLNQDARSLILRVFESALNNTTNASAENTGKTNN